MSKNTCPECGYDSPDSKCPECGYLKVSQKKCPECQTLNLVSERQCSSCGFPLLVPGPETHGRLALRAADLPLDYQSAYTGVAIVLVLGVGTFFASLFMDPLLGTRTYSMAGFGTQSRAKIASVKANMHTFQTVLETYAVDHGGMYPLTLDELYSEALSGNYWSDMVNPITERSGFSSTISSYLNYSSNQADAGKVLYRPLVPLGENSYVITAYQIYGLDKNGEMITSQDRVFVLESLTSDISNYVTAEPSLIQQTSKNTATGVDNLYTSQVDNTSQSDAERIADVIQKWQTVKRNVFVYGDLSELANVLTGKALEQTKGGADWWKKNGNYYSIELHDLSVQDLQLLDNDHAKVSVKISETKNNSVDGQKSSSYTARYYLTKAGSGWLIENMEAD